MCIVCYGVKSCFPLQISLFISKLESPATTVLRTEVMPCSINADSRSAFNIRNVNPKRQSGWSGFSLSQDLWKKKILSAASDTTALADRP